MLLIVRKAKKPANAASPKTSAGWRRVKFEADRKLVDRLIAHIVCIAFDAISQTPNQPSELGGILIEVIRRSLRGASKVADHLHATGQLIVQQPLHLISDCGGGFRCGLFGGTRCALRGFRHLGERVAALLTSSARHGSARHFSGGRLDAAQNTDCS